MKENYKIVKNAISKESADLLYNAMLYTTPNREPDISVPSADAYSNSAIGQTLLLSLTKKISEVTGKYVVPTYSYARIYETGNTLALHSDRPSCEYSASMCIGYDCSNVDENYNWPMGFKDEEGEVFVHLYPGDMVVYKGVKIPHWRDAFEGKQQVQMFLHYVDVEGPYSHCIYDNNRNEVYRSRFFPTQHGNLT